MKKTLLLLLVLLFALSVTSQAQKKTNNSTIPKPLKYAEGVNKCEEDIDILTQDKIVKIIRDFMKDDTLKGFEIEYEEDVLNNFKIIPDCYLINKHYKEDIGIWHIDLRYNIVNGYACGEDSDSQLDESIEQTENRLTIDECLKKAIDWLNERGYSLLGYEIDNKKMSEQMATNPLYQYDFMFNLKKNKELKGLGYAGLIDVEVDVNRGNILFFAYNTENIKALKDEGILSEIDIADIVKSFFTEEEIEGCKLNFITSPVQLEQVPISKIQEEDDFSDMVYEERVVLSCEASGVQNSELGMGIPWQEIGPNGEKKPKSPALYSVIFTFDAYNGYLYIVSNAMNGSLIPQDVGEKISKYIDSKKIEPKRELKEYPFELLTDEKLKEIKPTLEDVELVLFKDNSERIKFSQKDCGIEGLSKLENTEDIYTYTKDDNVYIFREGSPWCLVNNKTLLVSNCPVIKK